jgi:alkyl sulfatase BDS1-like metallo-beta-lactamase superfamily hydrolase
MTMRLGSVLALSTLLAACGAPPAGDLGPDADADGHGAATRTTVDANAAVAAGLALDDAADFDDARRGRIAAESNLVVQRASGETVWDQTAYAFVDGEAPPSVNPSLWRQAKLNGIHGLFEVTGGVYQLRGFDLSNMTIIAGERGWILVDPATVAETASRAIAFARRHLGEKPIRAILFTHSHIDHFGGVAGVVSAEQAQAEQVRIVAPAGFMEEATSENVMAGVAMGRRADYMYGRRLARSPRGHVDTGLGKEPPRGGTIGILAPTDTIDHTGQTLTLDGVEFVFQYTPGSEAPAEFTFYLPRHKAFCGAEVVSHNLHNVYTLRGAKVRDALRWSGYIDEAIGLFGDAEVYFGSHHWPIWGNAAIVDFLEKQRDTYKYLHDQTLRMANGGMTAGEIAAAIELPESLRTAFASRGYYGTAKHNARAVYQWYFGWYDGNPAHLDPLPPVEAAKKYVEFMGGAAAVVEKAEAAYERGEYRWVAEVVNRVVFAAPENEGARALLARAYDQLGYQAESGPWRDEYLTAAYELRHGAPERGSEIGDAIELLRQIPLPRFLDAMAARLNGPKADGKHLVVNLVFTDRDETHVLELKNAVLHHRGGEADGAANATVRLTHEFFLRMLTGNAGLRDVVFSDDLDVDGSRLDLLSLLLLLERPEGRFAIVTP